VGVASAARATPIQLRRELYRNRGETQTDGGAVSDRQWRDIQGIVRVPGAQLDVAYLREGAAVLGVQDLLDRALGPERSRVG
jgi:hypothetical protein